jgi:hypothetical protein
MASTPAIPSRAFFPQRKAYEHHELRPAKRSVTVPEISVSSPLYIATFPSLEISSEFRKPPEPVTLLPSSDSGSEKTTTADRFSVRSVPSFENDK